MVRGISEISDPPLVTTTTFLLLKIKLYPQIYKNRGAREPTRGNKRKITDYTLRFSQCMDKSVQERPPVRDEVSNRRRLAARVIAVPSGNFDAP